MHINYLVVILKAAKLIFAYARETETIYSFAYALLWPEHHWAMKYQGQDNKIWRKSAEILQHSELDCLMQPLS